MDTEYCTDEVQQGQEVNPQPRARRRDRDRDLRRSTCRGGKIKEHFAPSPRLASGSSSSLKKRKGGQENTQSSRRNAMGTAMQSCFAVDSNVWLIAGDMAHGL